MATPRNNAYTGTGGSTLYAGRPKPAWYESAPSGSWVELPNSTFSTSGVGWAGTKPGVLQVDNYLSVVKAWSGGILNTVGVFHGGAFIPGTFLVLFGGGHGDYGGNELYAYGPLQSSPVWRRLNDPTIPAADDVPRLGGYPVSRHTYDSLQFVSSINKMVCVGTAGYHHTGYTFNVCDVFDFAADPSSVNPWSTMDVGFPQFNGGGAGPINMLTVIEPDTERIWGLGNGNGQLLGSLNPATATWTNYSKDNPNGQNNNKAAYMPGTRLMVFVTAAGVYVQNLALPSSAIYSPTVSGTNPGVPSVALEWHPAGYFYFAAAGNAIHKLTPGANPLAGGDAWAWSTETAGGVTPAAALTNGTFGRFRRVPASGALPAGTILMRRHDAPIVFLKD